jgi:hypothetical protein
MGYVAGSLEGHDTGDNAFPAIWNCEEMSGPFKGFYGREAILAFKSLIVLLHC